MRLLIRHICDRMWLLGILQKALQTNLLKVLLLILPAGGITVPAWTQEARFRVIDMVDLAAVFSEGDPTGGYLEFREEWAVDQQRPSLLKKVNRYVVVYPQDSTACTQDSMVSPEERLRRFGERIRQLPARDGKVRISGIRYEFNLLDPHLEGSGTEDFQVPDSMDRATRELQQALIGLLRARTTDGNRYDWQQQMLSVEFSERWSIDTATMEIAREVEYATPVMWQRRQTEEGIPLDEAGTGFPVYYKNSLRPVTLRNP